MLKTNKPLNVYLENVQVPSSAGSPTKFEGNQMVFETEKKQLNKPSVKFYKLYKHSKYTQTVQDDGYTALTHKICTHTHNGSL